MIKRITYFGLRYLASISLTGFSSSLSWALGWTIFWFSYCLVLAFNVGRLSLRQWRWANQNEMKVTYNTNWRFPKWTYNKLGPPTLMSIIWCLIVRSLLFSFQIATRLLFGMTFVNRNFCYKISSWASQFWFTRPSWIKTNWSEISASTSPTLCHRKVD